MAYVFLYPTLSGERKAEQRMQSVARTEPLTRAARGPQKSRRDVSRNPRSRTSTSATRKAESIPLSVRIARAGLSWSKRQFAMISAGIGLAMFLIGLFSGAGLDWLRQGSAFAGAFGLPRWLLSFLKKRRESKFLEGISGCGRRHRARRQGRACRLLDCIKMITLEAPEPLKSEFRIIMETQAIGMPLGEACAKLYERTPLPEANFFGIVVAIQQKAGGNLSEALGNLSKVLRDRKKMKAKIQAMSQEAKASAGIIGALPIAVMTLVYLTSPQYISLLFTNPMGHLMLAGSAFWMAMGVLVMKKMINFDF